MRTALAPLLVLCAFPGLAFACALPPSVILTLPTGHYMTGAALTVAMTALIGASVRRLPLLPVRRLWDRPQILPRMVTSLAGFAGFLALVLTGTFGSTDPMHNLMTLVFWTGVWIAVPLLSLVIGNVWRPVNPWFAPIRLMRRWLRWQGSIGLSRLGHAPAVLGLLGFAWFQMVSLSPDDPTVLARTALAYWLVIFGLGLAEGEDWLDQGEFLTVLFAQIARIAPFWAEHRNGRVSVMAGLPGAQVLSLPPLSPSAIVFVSLVLASLTFDGLMDTFWWQGVIGQNPLEPVGRSAVIGQNTAGLLGTWVLTLTAMLGMVALMRLAGRDRQGEALALGRIALSFLAIAAGYHAAHYLVMLLTTGQYTLAALNDPLFRGDSLLGLPPFYVSFGFLSDPVVMPLLYGAQFALILAAHLLAVFLGLRLAGQTGGGIAVHVPLAGLLTGYTVLGLWLLSTARTG